MAQPSLEDTRLTVQPIRWCLVHECSYQEDFAARCDYLTFTSDPSSFGECEPVEAQLIYKTPGGPVGGLPQESREGGR